MLDVAGPLQGQFIAAGMMGFPSRALAPAKTAGRWSLEMWSADKRATAALRDANGMKTIVLVDDEPDVRSVISMRLERNGYCVLECDNGITALETVRRARPDLLILDWTLPGLSGLEVLKNLRADPSYRQVRVFVATGIEQPLVEQELHGLEVSAVFSKPFSAGDLMRKIEEAIGKPQP